MSVWLWCKLNHVPTAPGTVGTEPPMVPDYHGGGSRTPPDARVGRRGAVRLLPTQNSGERMRRAGNSRSSSSQGGLFKYSTRGTKHNMYVSSPKKSIRGRRAKGTVLGPRGSSTPPYPDHRRACATPATPGAYHRRVVSPRALLVIPVVICMCRLPTKNCPPDAPTALRVYAPL